jgi:hypothetical protein
LGAGTGLGVVVGDGVDGFFGTHSETGGGGGASL